MLKRQQRNIPRSNGLKQKACLYCCNNAIWHRPAESEYLHAELHVLTRVKLLTWNKKTVLAHGSCYKQFFFCGTATQRGSWPPHSWGFKITHNDAPQSVGLLWTSDQLAAETSTWRHTTLTTDKHPCPRWDLNPRSQSRRAAADLRLRPHSHWELLKQVYRF